MSDYSADGWGVPSSVPVQRVDAASLSNGIAKVSVTEKAAGDQGFGAKPDVCGAKSNIGFGSNSASQAPQESKGFGASSGFGSGSMTKGFGASNPSSGSEKKPTESGFGAPSKVDGSSGFEAKPEKSGFGSSSSGFGGGSSAAKGFGSTTTSTGFAKATIENNGFGSTAKKESVPTSGFGSDLVENKGFGTKTSGFGSSGSSNYEAKKSGFGASESSGFGSKSSFGGAESKSSGFGGNDSAGFGAKSSGFGGGDSSGFGAKSSGFGGGESSGFGAKSSGFGGSESTGFGAKPGFGSGDSAGFGGKANGFGGGGGGSRACFNCGEEGHRSNECTEPRKERAPQKCFNCEQEGHRSNECTEPKRERRGPMTCFNCQQEGHRSSDCTEPRKERGGRSGGAFGGDSKGFGGSSGGGSAGFGGNSASAFGGNSASAFGGNSASAFGGNSASAFGNGSSGFGGGSSTGFGDKPSSGFGGDSGNGCFHCGSEEHRGRECPTKPASTCFKCKQEGHMSKDCTNERVLAEGETAQPPKSTFCPDEVAENDLFTNHVEKGQMFDKFYEVETAVNSTSGAKVPQKIKSFDEVAFTEKVAENIRKSGYTRPTPVQQCAIPIIMDGLDMISVAQTGSGKTAAFLLPVIHTLVSADDYTPSDVVCRPRCIILAPTRELCSQIHLESRKFCNGTVMNTACIYGGTSVEYAKSTIARGATILVATVGRLVHFINEGLISTEKVKFFILDEADRMMEQDSFGPEVMQITSAPMPPAGERQTLMFSATFPDQLQKISAEILSKDYVMMNVDSIGCANKCITQEFVQCERSTKRKLLFDLLDIDMTKYAATKDNDLFKQKTIIFVESKKMADMLGLQLCESGIPTLTTHGDRLQAQRAEALREFTRGNKSVLVATAVAERGLDIKGVDHVINYDMPDNIDKYVHRIGRTGRVGNAGRATSFYDPDKDGNLAGDLVRILKQAEQIVPEFLSNSGSSTAFGTSGNQADDDW